MRNERPVLSERSESSGPDPIDALIDAAARRLVAGEPSSSLRRSVRGHVSQDSIARRPAWSLIPALAGASALVIVGVLVGRVLLGPPGETNNVRPPIERAQAPDVGPALSDPPGERDNVRPTSKQRAEERVQLRRLAAEVAVPQEEESLIPPIAIEPLATAPLSTAQIAFDQSSGVMPIEIEPLQIEPLRGD